MKSILSLSLFVCIITSGFSQSYEQVVKDTLSVTKVLEIGRTAHLGDISIKFKEVMNDSRCPKEVMCVRAGEAFVLVSILKNGKFIKDQKIRIDGSGFVSESNNLVFSNSDLSILGVSLTPYPKATEEIVADNYKLEVMVRSKIGD